MLAGRGAVYRVIATIMPAALIEYSGVPRNCSKGIGNCYGICESWRYKRLACRQMKKRQPGRLLSRQLRSKTPSQRRPIPSAHAGRILKIIYNGTGCCHGPRCARPGLRACWATQKTCVSPRQGIADTNHSRSPAGRRLGTDAAPSLRKQNSPWNCAETSKLDFGRTHKPSMGAALHLHVLVRTPAGTRGRAHTSPEGRLLPNPRPPNHKPCRMITRRVSFPSWISLHPRFLEPALSPRLSQRPASGRAETDQDGSMGPSSHASYARVAKLDLVSRGHEEISGPSPDMM